MPGSGKHLKITQNLVPNNITGDRLKKQNQCTFNTLFTTTQTVPAFDHVYEPELPDTPVIPLNIPLATPILDTEIETLTIGKQQAFRFILENELFIDTMMKKAHYTTFNKEIIMELQKRISIIFNPEFKSEIRENTIRFSYMVSRTN